MITFSDVKKAQERITPYIFPTPLLRVPALDETLGCTVYLKPENLQYTGSFKLRGAMNSILALTPEERKRGIVASSSGNHAQGVAYAAKLQGVDAIIVMPEDVNPAKLESVKSYGVQVILYGKKTSERDAKVKEIAEAEGRVQVHPFNFDNVKSGQGTIALEILEEFPEMDVLVAPIGGGGLISGVAVGAKGINPNICVVGVEPLGACRYTQSLKAGKPIGLEKVDTICDGTRTDRADPINYQLIKEYVDHIETVSDDYVKAAMKLLAQKAKLVIEPSSASVIAAFFKSLPYIKKEDRVCFILSGGNNDLDQFAQIIQS